MTNPLSLSVSHFQVLFPKKEKRFAFSLIIILDHDFCLLVIFSLEHE